MSFPKLLYPLQTIPLLSKQLDVNRLVSAFISFIWNGGGGMGINLPDIRLYNLASLLRHSIDWVKNTDVHSNLAMESSLVTPWSLAALLHTKRTGLACY